MLRISYNNFPKGFITQSRYIFRDVIPPSSSNHIYVIIPEIADVRNSLNIDNYSSLSPHDLFIEVSRIVQKFDTHSSILTDQLNKYHINQSFTYDNSILEIYKILKELDSTLKYVTLVSYSSDDFIRSFIAFWLRNKILNASHQLLFVNSLGFIIDELLKKERNDDHQNVLKMMKNNFTRFGGYMDNESTLLFRKNIKNLLRHQFKFNESIMKSQSKMQQYFDRSDLADNTPDYLLSRFKVPGLANSYMVNTLNNQLKQTFLKYCDNPILRNQVWLSTRQKGGRILNNFQSTNFKNIALIRKFRDIMADIFDYENYASFIFNTNSRMAGSLDDVICVLEMYKSKVLPLAEQEFTNLNEFARKEKGLQTSIMPWDNDYLQHCFNTKVLNCPWSKLELDERRFNINVVIERILHLFQKIFSLTFNFNYINDNEIKYEVSYENNVGEVIFKINRNSLKDFIDVAPLKVDKEDKTIKASYIIINLPFDNPDIFNCLKIVEVIGEMLKYQLCDNDITVCPLITGLPPDAKDIASKFILHLFLSSKDIIYYIFPELGKSLCQDLSESHMKKSLHFINNISCLEALYVSYFDIEMSLSRKSWQNVQRDLWHDFFGSSSKLYYPFTKYDEWPCSASEIFADEMFGGLKKYSCFWTDNIVQILYRKFTTAKFNNWNPNEDLNPELLHLFKEFQKTFVDQSNSIQNFLLSDSYNK